MRRLDRLWALKGRVLAATSLTVFLACQLAGCGGVLPAPKTAKEFAERYPPIRDPNLVNYILDNRMEILRRIGNDDDKDVIRHVFWKGAEKRVRTILSSVVPSS